MSPLPRARSSSVQKVPFLPATLETISDWVVQKIHPIQHLQTFHQLRNSLISPNAGLINNQASFCDHVIAENGIKTAVAGFGVPYTVPATVRVSHGGPAGLMRPAAILILPVPVIIRTRPNNQCYIPALALHEGIGEIGRLNQPIGLRRGLDIWTSPRVRLCSMSASGLRKSVGFFIVGIIVAIVIRLNSGHIPRGRVINRRIFSLTRRTKDRDDNVIHSLFDKTLPIERANKGFVLQMGYDRLLQFYGQGLKQPLLSSRFPDSRLSSARPKSRIPSFINNL